jgi:hypothetical protein
MEELLEEVIYVRPGTRLQNEEQLRVAVEIMTASVV